MVKVRELLLYCLCLGFIIEFKRILIIYICLCLCDYSVKFLWIYINGIVVGNSKD